MEKVSILKKTHIASKQEKKKKADESLYKKPEKPTKEVLFNDFNIPETRKKNTQKIILSKILAFIDSQKNSRFRNVHNGLTVIPISCKKKKLVSMCGSHQQVSNLIKYMIEIGIITEYDSTYQFNAYYARDNRSKTYCYSCEAEDKFIAYCKENNINAWKKEKKSINPNPIKIGSFEVDQVRFSSKVHFLKPSDYSVTEFEEYIEDCLHKNYPWLTTYQDLVDKLNELYFYNDSDREIRFEPHFEWNKGNKAVTKIGIRATNSLCNSKKEREPEDDKKDYTFLYRDEVKKAYGLSYEYDVKSSVPRITKLLNTGVWLDESIDLYQEMAKTFNELCPQEALEWNEENRDVFKSFHMRGYFDTKEMLATHIKRDISTRIEYKKEDWVRLDDAMIAYKASVENTLGHLYDSEIFFHESCVYLSVLERLLSRGYNVVQIYDGFYLDKECKDIKSIIEEEAINYYDKYINKQDKIKLNKENNYIDTIVQTFDNNKEEEQIIPTVVDTFAIEKPKRVIIRPEQPTVIEKRVDYGYAHWINMVNEMNKKPKRTIIRG